MLLNAQIRDYRMLHGSGSQVGSPRKAARQTSRSSEGVASGIRRKAQQEWPDDYEMQEYKEKNQIEAYRRLR